MEEIDDVGDEAAVGGGGDVGGEEEVGQEQPDAEKEVRSRFDVRNLLPEGVKVHHLKELKSAAKLLDQVRSNCDAGDPDALELAALKFNLSLSKSVEEMVETMGCNERAIQAMSRLVEQRVLEELLTIGTDEGVIPLSEWPNSQMQNFFVEVVKLAARKTPITLSLLLRLILKNEEANVEPVHVINVATVFSQLSHLADKSNNALSKINSLQLKMHGLTDEGLDAQVPLGLGVTARTLRSARDDFAEVAETCLVEETKSRPVQSTLDNCDQKGSHSTVEYLEVEYEDTTHLSVDAMGPEEVLQLFNVDLLLLNREELKDEKDHLERIILTETAKVLSHARPEIGHWLKLLPRHHSHPHDHLPLREASIVLRPPHWLQETKQDEMIQLAVTLQDEVLDTLLLHHPNDHQLHADLALIRKPAPGNESHEDKKVRVEAEQRVKCAVLDSGERIGTEYFQRCYQNEPTFLFPLETGEKNFKFLD